jgi:hypothetical protein
VDEKETFSGFPAEPVLKLNFRGCVIWPTSWDFSFTSRVAAELV